jgi:hypothetical protein
MRLEGRRQRWYSCQFKSVTLDHCCPGFGKSSRAGVRSGVALEAIDISLNCIDTCRDKTVTRLEVGRCGRILSLRSLFQLIRLGGGNLTTLDTRLLPLVASKLGVGRTTTRDSRFDSPSVISCAGAWCPMSSAFQYFEALCEWPTAVGGKAWLSDPSLACPSRNLLHPRT